MADKSTLTTPSTEEIASESLKHIQSEMADIFADLAGLFGNPASLGSIYGLLFTSPDPLSMEEIVDKLDISVGTASQGLRRLAELEAITSIKAEGQRTTRYSAKLEMRHYVSFFLYQQLLPKLERSSSRIAALEKEVLNLSPYPGVMINERLHQAAKWHRLSKTLLPLVRGFIKG